MSYDDEAILSDNMAHKMAMEYKSKIQALEVAVPQQETTSPADNEQDKQTAAKYIVNIISFLKQLLYLSNRYIKVKQNKEQINTYIDIFNGYLTGLNLPQQSSIIGTYNGHFYRDYKHYVDTNLRLISLLLSNTSILPSSAIQDSINLLQLLNNIVI